MTDNEDALKRLNGKLYPPVSGDIMCICDIYNLQLSVRGRGTFWRVQLDQVVCLGPFPRVRWVIPLPVEAFFDRCCPSDQYDFFLPFQCNSPSTLITVYYIRICTLLVPKKTQRVHASPRKCALPGPPPVDRFLMFFALRSGSTSFFPSSKPFSLSIFLIKSLF